MHTLPLTFCLFTSSKGHWGSRDLYKATLNHYDRQLPLALFGARLAHVKVGVNEQDVGDAMEADLKARGFEVIKTVADWSRGTAHQHGILLDQRTVSRDPRFHTQPFALIAEDDSPVVAEEGTLTDLLLQSCRALDEDHELVSVRTLRREDLDSSPRLPPRDDDARWFYSPHWNLQPGVVRSRDFYLGCNAIEANWAQVNHLQCELLWRLVWAGFSTSEYRHRVWHPSVAYTPHLGVENHAAVLASLNL